MTVEADDRVIAQDNPPRHFQYKKAALPSHTSLLFSSFIYDKPERMTKEHVEKLIRERIYRLLKVGKKLRPIF